LRTCLFQFVEDAQRAALEHGVTPAEHQLLKVEAAIDRICNGLSIDMLQLQRSATMLFWNKVHADVIMPGLVMASGEAAEVLGVRPWQVLTAAMEHVAEGMSGPGLLLAQVTEFKLKLQAFWEKYEEVQDKRRTKQAADRSALAMEGLAAVGIASLGLRGRMFQPGGGRAHKYEESAGMGAGPSGATAVSGVGAALHAVDEVWKHKPPAEAGCKFWSGIEGSCRTPGKCGASTSHVAGQPAPWYSARARVWQQHGGITDAQGNYTIPHIGGVKRPATGEAGAESVSSFRG
jgi:hypothetical protein